MYVIIFYVPEDHLESVKQAVFAAGAGHVGNYEQCAWQVCGEGQFMPLKGSSAFIGEVDRLEKVIEYRVEIDCYDDNIHAVVAALKKAHPYEEPAYTVVRCEPI